MHRETAVPGASLVPEPGAQDWADFPIPGHTGRLDAAFLSRDLALGPIMAALTLTFIQSPGVGPDDSVFVD